METEVVIVQVIHSGDVGAARGAAKTLAASLGFDETAGEEVALVASELASNLVKHAGGGMLTLAPLAADGRAGIELVAADSGRGIPDVNEALADGFSTGGSLGYGLGAVNRLMDELEITSHRGPGSGTRVVCRKWARPESHSHSLCPLAIGAASRPHPSMTENGDAFVIKRWDGAALAGVIDGLGHGQFARRASQTARQYVETHYDQPLESIFRGVERACRATRGVVMALAKFDFGMRNVDFGLPDSQSAIHNPKSEISLTFASVGNVEARVFDASGPVNFVIRRGVIGANAPGAVVTHHAWDQRSILVLHSDGVRAHWRREDFPALAAGRATAAEAAGQLLRALAKGDDDATVLVVKGL